MICFEILAFYPINYLNKAGNQTEPFEGWPGMFPAARKEQHNMYEELRLNIVAEETAVYHTYKDRVFLFCGAGAEKP